MDDPMKELKTSLRSLLISAPKGLTIRELIHDYKNFVGNDFPHRKLGYRTPEDLLINLPDVVKISTIAGEKILTAVADESTAHIEKLVSKQRSSTSGYHNRPRRLTYNYDNYQPQSSYVPDVGMAYFPPPVTRRRTLVPDIPRFRRMHDRHLNRTSQTTNNSQVENAISNVLKDHPEGAVASCNNYPTSSRVNSDSTLTKPIQTTSEKQTRKPRSASVNLNEKYLDSPALQSAPLSFTCNKNPIERPSSSSLSKISDSRSSNHVSNGEDFRPILSNPHSNQPASHITDEMEPVSNQLKLEFKKILEKYPGGLDCIRLPSAYKEIMQKDLNYSELGFPSIMALVTAIPDVFVFRRTNSKSSWLLYDASKGMKKTTAPIQTTSSYCDVLEIPLAVKKQVVEVLKLYPRGILLEAFPIKFKEKHNEEVPCNKYGYASAEMMLTSLIDDVVSIHYTSSNVGVVKILTEALDKYGPALAFSENKTSAMSTKEQNSTKNSRGLVVTNKINSLLSLACACVGIFCATPTNESFPSALVIFLFSFISVQGDQTKKNIPPDAVLPGQELPQQEVKVDTSPLYVRARVSHVTDGPSCFYIQLVGAKTTTALEDVMNCLEKDYSTAEGSRYGILEEHLTTGLVCAAIYPEDNNWHRAVIISAEDKHKIEVCYIDYGTVSKVRKHHLRYLKSYYMNFPAQALQSRLANIRPAHGRKWSTDACRRFFQVSVDVKDDLMVMIVSKRLHPLNKEQVLFVCLCDTSDSEKEVHINDLLVDEGFAELHNEDGTYQSEKVVSPTPSMPLPTPPMQLPWPTGMMPSLNPFYPFLYHQLMANPFLFPPVPSPDPEILLNQFKKQWSNTLESSISKPLMSVKYNDEIDLTQNTDCVTNNIFKMPLTGVSPEMLHETLHKTNISAATKGNVKADPLKKPIAKEIISEEEYIQSVSPLESGFKQVTNVGKHTNNSKPAAIEDKLSMLQPLDNAGSPSLTSDFGASDDLLEHLCKKLDSIPSLKKRFVKFVQLTPNHQAHVILYNKVLNMIREEISALFWKKDMLETFLRIHCMKVQATVVSEETAPLLFEELVHYRISVPSGDDKPNTVKLYSLANVLVMVEKFKSQDLALKEAIKREMDDFNIMDTYWGLEPEDDVSSTISNDLMNNEGFEFGLQVLRNRKRVIEKQLQEEPNRFLEEELHLIKERIAAVIKL